jgi:hypothetical protein
MLRIIPNELVSTIGDLIIIMSGKIKRLIDYIIEETSADNQALKNLNKAKLMLKGVDVARYNELSADSEEILELLNEFADDFGLDISQIEDGSINIKVAYSKQTEIDLAIKELEENFGDFKPDNLIYFASYIYDSVELSRKIQEKFLNIQNFGCATMEEIVTGKILDGSIVAIGFNKNVIKDMHIEIIENSKSLEKMPETIKNFELYFDRPFRKLEHDKYLGIVFIDGMCECEEKIMDKLVNYSNIVFTGASIADYKKMASLPFFANGKTYSDSILIAILELNTNFHVFKTQNFKATDKVLVSTKVNHNNRQVLEFNNMPATIAYAKALDIDVKYLPEYLNNHPLGLLVYDEIFVRSPMKIVDESILFYANIPANVALHLLEPVDIIKQTQADLYENAKKLPRISGIINFDCWCRMDLLARENRKYQYINIFKDIPMIGFSSYGEEYIGHTNQTSTMIIFE